MKRPKIKLSLNKETIAKLNDEQMSKVMGGEAEARTYSKFPCTLLISNCIRCCPRYDAAGIKIDDTMMGADNGEELGNNIGLINQAIFENDTNDTFFIH